MNKSVYILSSHHQIMICDEADRTSVAQWFTGNEIVVFGPKGINVAVADYQDIKITFRRTEEPAGILNKILEREDIKQHYQCLASGVIHIGNLGIRVASPSDDGEIVEWEGGMTQVEIWMDALRTGTKVLFLLNPLPKGYAWLFEQDYEL